jgi:hypothetical protein
MENSNIMNQNVKEEFTNNVKDYLELDAEISKINTALRERKVKQKALSEMIIRNMETNDIHHINIKNGVLVYKNEEKYKGLNKTNLINGLSIYFNNDERKVTGATQTVMDNREKINKIKLKLQKF